MEHALRHPARFGGAADAASATASASRPLRWQYKLFWLVFLLEFVNPFYDFLYYIANVNVVFLFKLPLLSMVAVCAVYHLQHRLIVTAETLLFIVFGAIALVYGAIANQRIDSHYLTHIYTAVMPILAMSFGAHFAREFDVRAKVFLSRLLTTAFYLSAAAVLLYLYFYYVSEQIGYFGYGSYLPFVAAFLLTQRRYLKYLLALVLVVFSGKRSTTISIVGITLLYLMPRLSLGGLFRLSVKRVLAAALIAMAAWISVGYLADNGYLRRFAAIRNFDFADDTAMFVASGGRWTEVQGIARAFGDDPVRWAFGKGMGAHYTIEIPLPSPYTEEFHYAHFSPMGFVLVYGTLFTVLLYVFMFRTVFRGLEYRRSFFYLVFISLFAGSFFGATLFVDPKTWFFYGVVKSLGRIRSTKPL